MLGRAYRGLLRAGAVVAALLLGAVALLVTADVVARNVGLGSIPWIIEVSEYSLPLATFLVAPWLLHRGEHVRLDKLWPPCRPPPAVRSGGWLTRWASPSARCSSSTARRRSASSARQGSLVIKAVVFPEWWLYAPVPVCFALLAVEFARRLAGRAPPAGTGPRP